MAKKEAPKQAPPRHIELPDSLTENVKKAWRALARKLDESELLTDDQWGKKGLIWKYVTLIPDKIKRYQITKGIKDLYKLSNGEYEQLKTVINVYGKYVPEMYNAKKPLDDITKSRLKRWHSDLLDKVNEAA